jgi:hypothetical protein
VGIPGVDNIVNVWNYYFSSKGLIGMKREDEKRREKEKAEGRTRVLWGHVVLDWRLGNVGYASRVDVQLK